MKAYLILIALLAFACREAPDIISELPQGLASDKDGLGGSLDAKTTPEEELSFKYAESGDLESLQTLLDKNPDLIYFRSPSTGRSILESAVLAGKLDIVDYLISLDSGIVYGNLMQILETTKLIDDATRESLMQKITTGAETQDAINNSLFSTVVNGIDDPSDLSDLTQIENLIINKSADVYMTEFFYIPQEGDFGRTYKKLGLNLLYRALGCQKYYIEWMEEDDAYILDYFDLDCGAVKKPKFIKMLIDMGVDYTQKVSYFDEMTSFEDLIAEFEEDFSSEEFQAIQDSLAKRIPPVYEALGCSAKVTIGKKTACNLSSNTINDEGIAVADYLVKNGADLERTILIGSTEYSFTDFIALLLDGGQITEQQHLTLTLLKNL